MALADYRLCDVCGGKAFYDANLNYEEPRDAPDQPAFKIAGSETANAWGYRLGHVGDWGVICSECARTHEVRIVRKAGA